MAKTPLFASLFKQSPLRGIEQHMEKCVECAKQLIPYFEAVQSEDWAAAEAIYEHITTLEAEADDMKQEIRSNLPRTLLMPMSRQDLLELLHSQDKIPNTAKDIAGLILGRSMSFPKELHQGLMALSQQGIAASQLVNQAVDQLHDLAHTGFSDKSTVTLGSLLDELQDVEHKSDIEQRNLRKIVFELEASMDPVHTMFVYRIIDLLGDLADESESTGNRILCITFS